MGRLETPPSNWCYFLLPSGPPCPHLWPWSSHPSLFWSKGKHRGWEESHWGVLTAVLRLPLLSNWFWSIQSPAQSKEPGTCTGFSFTHNYSEFSLVEMFVHKYLTCWNGDTLACLDTWTHAQLCSRLFCCFDTVDHNVLVSGQEQVVGGIKGLRSLSRLCSKSSAFESLHVATGPSLERLMTFRLICRPS